MSQFKKPEKPSASSQATKRADIKYGQEIFVTWFC